MIYRGLVSSIEEDGVRVARIGADPYVTGPLFLPPHIPTVRVGQCVVFVEFVDLTGAILCALEV